MVVVISGIRVCMLMDDVAVEPWCMHACRGRMQHGDCAATADAAVHVILVEKWL